MKLDLFTLRRQQHCTTCRKPNYPKSTIDHYCKCTDCTCGYCRKKIPHMEDPAYMALEREIIMETLLKTEKDIEN